MNTDLAIIGGGPVGLSAALALQHPARRITVIEAGNLERPESGGLNARSIALAASSVQIFRALGIWSQIESEAAPIRHIHVSARGRWGITRLDAADYDLEALGYVVESTALGRCLFDAAAASPLVEIEQEAEFENLSQRDSVAIDYRKQGEPASCRHGWRWSPTARVRPRAVRSASALASSITARRWLFATSK